MIRVDRRPFLYRLSRYARFRPLVALVALAVVGTVLSVGGSQSSDTPQTVADLSQFNPGNIISDEVFFFGAAMSAADIQRFLDAHNPNCVGGPDGTPCLRSFTQTTTSRSADAYCNGYVGAANESAATIIAKVAVSCNISPKVLLVTLQKEQSLVTDSAGQLYAKRYQKATGYACPDTAPCDTSYYGFENQVFMSAWQFQKYAHNPDGYTYRAGHTVNILYNPNAACGSSSVFIQNQATAGLYIYTPYQPDAAILRGGSDTCSSTGNLNFWRYFTDWFISTQSDAVAAASPSGAVDQLSMTAQGFVASGWAFDPDAPTSPDVVNATVDGVIVSRVQATGSRPDVATAFGVGPDHGYSLAAYLGHGTHLVCITAENVAGQGVSVQLQCQQMDFTNQAPVISIGAFAEQPDGSVEIDGWAYDPDGTATAINVYDNGVARSFTPSIARPDVQAAYSSAGPNSGFSAVVGPLSGAHELCVNVVDTGAPGNNFRVTCSTFQYAAPVGWVEAYTETEAGDLRISGWVFDPSTPTTPTAAQVYVDGHGVSVVSNLNRPDIAAAYPAAGAAHGFSTDVHVAAGTHGICVYGWNLGIGGTSPLLRCATVTLQYKAPLANVESITAIGGGQVRASGWAFDPSVPTAAATIHVWVDGRPTMAVTADQARPDVGRFYAGIGDSHGFDQTLTLSPGTHQVCVFALNLGVAGPNVLQRCENVTT